MCRWCLCFQPSLTTWKNFVPLRLADACPHDPAHMQLVMTLVLRSINLEGRAEPSQWNIVLDHSFILSFVHLFTSSLSWSCMRQCTLEHGALARNA